MHQVEGRTLAKEGGRNEPRLPWGWRRARSGGGQVRKPERSVMKRSVREQQTAGPASNTFMGHSAWNFSGEAGNLGLYF